LLEALNNRIFTNESPRDFLPPINENIKTVTKQPSLWRILFLLLVLTPIVLPAQSNLQDLYQRLEATNNPREKMRLNYELATLNLARKPSVATFQANQAYKLAKSINDNKFLSKSAVLLGKSFINQSDNDAAIKWLKTGEKLAKSNKDLSLLLETSTLQSGIEIRNNNYKRAYEINLAAINYVNKNKNSFQKTVTVTAPKSNNTSSVEIQKLKANELKFMNDNEELRIQNEILNEELLRLQYELADKQLLVDSANQDSQKSSGNFIDTNRTSGLRDSLKDQIPAFIEYEKSNREKLFSWMSAILGLLSLGLLSALYFLNKKKEEQKEMFDDSLLRKERLIKNYKEEIDEQGALTKTILGSGKNSKAKKIDPLTMLIVDLGSNLEFEGNRKTTEFVQFYEGLLKDIHALLSQYPSVVYIKKIGTTLIFATGVNKQKDDPDQLLIAAKDIQSYVNENQNLKESVKIGIHSGPVFLSTIDYNTESLDILGHTFDQCAWIQSLAKNGQIVISGIAKSLLNQTHNLEFLGKKNDWTGQSVDLYELN